MLTRVTFTGIWGLISLETDFFFFPLFLYGGGGKQQLQMHSLHPWLLRHSGLGNRLVQQMNACVTALLPREVQQDPT